MRESGPRYPRVSSTLSPRAPDSSKLAGRYVDLERLDVAGHVDDLWESIGQHADLWTQIPSGPFATREALAAWAADRSTTPGTYMFAIREKRSGRVLGLYFLLRVEPAHGFAEIGLIYGPALQRSVAGTEAFFLLANYVLGELAYRRLEWRCSPEHVASRRAAARYGFREEGTLRQRRSLTTL